MLKGKLKFDYKIDTSIKSILIEDNYIDNDLEIIFKYNEDQLTIDLYTKVKIKIISVDYEINRVYLPSEKVFVNGFQSWTDSKEYDYRDKMPRISPLTKPIINKYALDKYGDYDFVNYSNKKGDFHGFTYSYMRQKNRYELIASLNEKNGYTIFYHHLYNHLLNIQKDIKGIDVVGHYNLLDICHLIGSENEVFDSYFDKLDISQPKHPKMNGWTSWYNYYENISEDIILENLQTFHDLNKDVDIFQIDDGFETYVGDWLDVDQTKFPRGLKVIADDIKSKGYKAGLWLAPFVCEKNSNIFKEHQDWILKNDDNSLVHAGHNWSGFYALDIYNTEVRAYIKNVFDIVLNQWGFDMVKLDFLYAISLISYKNKSRGQIMSEGMEFIRECVGEKIILACGVPLGPSFGLVDYCRIGCDVGLDWDDKPYMRLMHRERISTLNSIHNTIYRRQLNGRAFMNDPDVFMLRDDNIKLTSKEKELLAFINNTFGGLIFTSDNIGLYSEEKMTIFDDLLKMKQMDVLSVEEKKKQLICITYKQSNFEEKHVHHKISQCYLNLSSKKIKYKDLMIPSKSVFFNERTNNE